MIQTLVVCEKPDAAAHVARALDEDGEPRRMEIEGVPVYESRNRDETVFVSSAIGHLYAVDSKDHTTRRYYPVWDYVWKPKNLIDKRSVRVARWIRAIASLASKADRYVNACDYDIEGSLIGYTILRYACSGAHTEARRMKFSTMTERELRTAYKQVSSHLDLSQVEAGRCRHELDWLYGINLSRLLTESTLKQNGGYHTLSTGRVQGPTLKFVVQREEDIACFTPTPFWTIDATILHDGHEYPLEYETQKILVLANASKVVDDCKEAVLEVVDAESRDIQQPPPYPFDLSTLQSEAYRNFGYTPARTLALAERLYLEALISYPRTSSQKLPPDIRYSQILKGIASRAQYRHLALKLANQDALHPSEGPKEDPAHPAVYPTGESPRRTLLPPETRLLDLIIKRFMATFAQPSLRESSRLTLKKESHKFFIRGTRLAREGWIEFYKPYAKDESQKAPDLKVGDAIPIHKIRSLEKFTEPPPRYNPASLLRKMEDENIGTKATRAEIIDIMYRRDYIKNIRIEATPLAQKIIALLGKYCPLIIDPSFTAELEKQMESIQTLQTSRRSVLAETLGHLRPVMLNLMAKEDELGSQLAEVVVSQRDASITFDCPCPQCESRLRIVRSRKSGKRFIGCTGYERGCRFTLPLPQFGRIYITRSNCKVCGFQQIRTRTARGRQVTSCPRCYVTRTRDRPGTGESRDATMIRALKPSQAISA